MKTADIISASGFVAASACKGVMCMRRFAVVSLCLMLLVVGGLVGCAPANDDEQPDSNAAVEEAQEHEAVFLRVAVPAELQGAAEELTDAYAADKDWLSFEVKAYQNAKKLNAAITPTIEAPKGDEGNDAGPTEGQDAPEAASGEEEPLLLPEAEIVFENSASAMNSAEEIGATDPQTRSEMLEDRLVIVASADSTITSATIANIEAGSYPLAVVTGKSVHAKRQFEVLGAAGVYVDGAYAGYYATANDAVIECEDTAGVFALVAKTENMVALVREGDLYRYGGVKVVGAVPARMYTAIRYPQALGANLSLLENGQEVEQTARDFLTWLTTDETALRIIEKWGLHYAA